MRPVLALSCALVLAGLLAPAASADLPVLRIDGPRTIPNEPKVPARLTMPGYGGRIAIEVRGQSSQRFPKQSYALELRDREGEDRKVPLLGMPADGDWVLYGPYNDKTLMRNVVAYRTAEWMGRYAARTRFVELRLNGRYHGIYVLMEKLELGDDRVQGEALYELTFPFQARSKAPSFRTPVTRRPIVWEDPERGDLSAREAARLARPVRALERALYGGGGWRKRLHLGSAVDFALVNELFKNEDGFHASTYLSLGDERSGGEGSARDRGRIHFGPVWDFDISMGNSTYGPSRTLGGWMLRERDWAERLYRDERFTDRLARRWRALRRDGLRGAVLRTAARSRRELAGELEANFARWPVLDRRIWPNPVARGSYTAEYRALRRWLTRRIAWIDRHVGSL